MTQTATTSDGRRLAFCEWGDPEGFPVFQLHGTPGSRLGRHPDENVYRQARVRLITYDRAGYGESTRHPGRRVADAAADVAAIADALALTRFAIFGGSGGAPHALAAGALLPDRVTRCASVVGPAPYEHGGLPREQWFTNMVEGNVKEFTWALEGEATLRPELERETEDLLAKIASDAEDPLGEDYKLSDQDTAVLEREDIRSMLAASTREGIGRSVDGFVDDDLAFTQPWGFDVSTLTVPTGVWYGPHDTLVPAGHGEWLGRTIPRAQVVKLDGGHFAIYDRMADLLAWLTGESE
ncbi:MAG: alpha/beta hydrolase [Solirubrobacterales bacterium]|nr:alpha/beta hydrolase [Solirubrobacterales bacterium]